MPAVAGIEVGDTGLGRPCKARVFGVEVCTGVCTVRARASTCGHFIWQELRRLRRADLGVSRAGSTSAKELEATYMRQSRNLGQLMS